MGVDFLLRARRVIVGDGVELLDSRQGWGQLAINQSVAQRPLRVGGREFTSGLGVHASSSSEIVLTGGGVLLTGACGVDDGAGDTASLRCRVRSRAGALLFESPVLRRGDQAVSFAVRTDDTHRLILETDAVDVAAGDHVDWLELVAHP